MICKSCRGKSIVRGIKLINCFKCGGKAMVNYLYQNYCKDCSNTLQKCQRCGEREEVKDC